MDAPGRGSLPASEQDVGELTRVVHRSPGVPDEVAHDPSDDDHQSHRERGGDVPKASTTSAAVLIASTAKGPASQRKLTARTGSEAREAPSCSRPGSTDDLG